MDWSAYWQGKDSSLRWNVGRAAITEEDEEDFYRSLADEQAFHLGRGGSLLDFACGAGEVLSYMAPWYTETLAVDFSEKMLNAARARIESNPPAQVPTFLLADDRSVWTLLDGRRFNRILASGVVQYLDPERLVDFLVGAARHLADDGRMLLGDILDPRLLFLFERGLLGARCSKSRFLLRIAVSSARLSARRALGQLRGRPVETLGETYCPGDLREIATRAGFDVDLPWSMRQEYRYHAILVHSSSRR